MAEIVGTALGQRKEHQAKTCKEYSTEQGGGCRRGGLVTHQLSTHADEEQDKDEIRSEENQQDFAALEIEDPADQGEPGNSKEHQRKKKAAGWPDVRGRAEKDLEGVEKEEDGEEENGEARPAMEGEPGVGESKVEPAGNEEMEKEGGKCRREKRERLGGESRQGEAGMKQEQGKPRKEEKAGEIVALVEGQGAKRHPMAEQKNHGERDAGEFEKESRKGWKGRGARRCGNFAAKCFAEKGASKENDAAEAEKAAKNVGPRRNDSAAGKMEDAGGPVLDSCRDAGGEKDADVGVAGDRGEFDGGISARGGKIGGVPDQAWEFILADEDERIGLERRRVEVEEVFSGDAMGGLHGCGGNGDNACGAKLGRETQRDGATHGVAHEDGVVRKNQAACGEAAHEGTRAGFGRVGREGAIGTAVAGKIGDVDSEALRREAARKVGHDDFVGGQAVKENDGAALGIFGEAGFLDDVHGERAGAGVHEVVMYGEAARGIEGEGRTEEDKQNARGSEKGFFMFHVEGRLRERGRERA